MVAVEPYEHLDVLDKWHPLHLSPQGRPTDSAIPGYRILNAETNPQLIACCHKSAGVSRCYVGQQ